jgi:hypothetical protein
MTYSEAQTNIINSAQTVRFEVFMAVAVKITTVSYGM